jgi:tRNA 2-thiouridine synthesizing protein A
MLNVEGRSHEVRTIVLKYTEHPAPWLLNSLHPLLMGRAWEQSRPRNFQGPALPGCSDFLPFINSGGSMANFDKELDARGLNCPLPILRTKKVLAELGSGQTLKIIATDPGSVKDFQAFAKQTGNDLLESSEAGGEYTFFIKKK